MFALITTEINEIREERNCSIIYFSIYLFMYLYFLICPYLIMKPNCFFICFFLFYQLKLNNPSNTHTTFLLSNLFFIHSPFSSLSSSRCMFSSRSLLSCFAPCIYENYSSYTYIVNVCSRNSMILRRESAYRCPVVSLR